MDTKEKNRETTRKQKPQTEQRSRRPAPKAEKGIAALLKKRPAAKASEEKRRRPVQETAAKPRRPRPQTDENAEVRQRRERPAQEQQPVQRRQRPAEAAQPVQNRPRPVNDNRNTHQSAEIRRPARTEQMQVNVPKGTGPRMSAPRMSAGETEALHRQQRRQAVQQPQMSEKKNALQNFISGVKGEPMSADAAERAEQRRKERAARAEKKRKQAERNDTPALIYTQPMAFSRDRLLIQLFTVTAVVVALVLGMSVFFKVETITVAGAETYSAWAIREASGIKEGDSLLTFSKAKASAQIQAKHAYVDDVRIGIKLPDTVIIYIEELDVAYAMESTQGDWWLINSSGRIVEQVTANEAKNHTQLLGVRLEEPQVGNNAVAANEIPQETLASGEPVPLSVTGEQRLSSGLQILKALEANDIVGEAASVDVTSLDDVMLWYGSRYEVILGDTSRMEYKIACMSDAILQMSDYQSGILDVSFTHWVDQVGYTPFG